jgi:hypothetical protein
MAYIWASSHNVLLEPLIAKDIYAWVYAHVLNAHFKFYLFSIYIEEEVLSKSSKVDMSIMQLRFHDNEGHHWVLSFEWYRALHLL